jgi:hypothetical protein
MTVPKDTHLAAGIEACNGSPVLGDTWRRLRVGKAGS